MLQPHIQLDETVNTRYAILPGDPGRLDRIALQLEDVRELAFNREFRSRKGNYKGIPILAISTGIGGPSAAIAMEELRNIGVRALVRIGSCGALQEGIALGDLLFACAAIRAEGTPKAHVDARFPAGADSRLLRFCEEAAEEQGWPWHEGIVHSHESFYIDTNDQESEYWSSKGALGADMETAALLTAGRRRGLRAASILNNVVLWGNDTADAIGGYASGEDMTAVGEKREIAVALEALYRLSKEEKA